MRGKAAPPPLWLRPSGALLAGLVCACGPCAVSSGNSRMCIENTGGACTASSCDEWRGSTRCDRGTGLGRCFCTDGTCSGSDGKCYDPNSAPYSQVGGDQVFQIRNARWPAYFMYVLDTGAVAVSKKAAGDKGRFAAMALPSGGTRQAYLLYSKEWEDSAVYLRRQLGRYSARSTSITGGMLGLPPDPSIRELGLHLTRSPVPSPTDNRTLVMLSGLEYSDRYFYVPRMSSFVSVHENDPGAGGYWYFEPPLPADVQAGLQQYAGPRCSWRCGEAQVVAGARRSGIPTAWAALAALAAALASAVSPAAPRT